MNPEPVATYRIQLRPGFGFEEAAALVDYLTDLGVSHLYTSPCLQAARGSTHGYDVVDPSRVNEELGGAGEHARLCEKLRAAGLGRVIDVVPNHMAIEGDQNPWWWDVLESGPSSRYATCFDVDWEASAERWPNKVLLPVLGDHYGRILEDGQLQLSHEAGVFILHYHEQQFPIDPSSLPPLLGRAAEACASENLAFLAQSHARLPRPTVTARKDVERRHRDKAVLVKLLERLCREEPEAAEAIDAEVARLNRDPDALDALIEQQNYRLALWRTASRELGYRRFFDIKDLAGLRVEDPEVFDAVHALPLAWAKQGWVQGLRIDHPDGMRDPAQYFHRLREACPEAWILAEKILESDEKLPPDWPVEGTTGYDFLNLAGGLFVDAAGEEAMTRIYEEFTGESADYEATVRECKRHGLNELLASELNRLSSLFVDICERHRRYRDYTRYELREALCETAVCFPVYRSYVRAPENVVSPEDETYIRHAIETAAEARPDLDPELFEFLRELLLLRVPGELEGELAIRFQQLSAPAMAKGVEDTAFYRFHRLVSLNEVGGDPGRFGVPLELFHERCREAQRERPRAMLASTTHDTKRSEDVRARLALLSEIPERWSQAVHLWAAHNERHWPGELRDRNIEYLFYQTLVGAWPITVERMTGYMEKAVREAKTQTSWTQQNETYERAIREFVEAVMDDAGFRSVLEEFVGELVGPGRINSLAQTLIKLTAPGAPDIYQGTELWDLSLVDPDNRRPVDFETRRGLLEESARLSLEEMLGRMDEGLPKLHVIRQALRLRREHPESFGEAADYQPLSPRGGEASRVVAFVRGGGALTLTPRLLMGFDGDWKDTAIDLPAGRWRNRMTDEDGFEGGCDLKALLARFPVALLAREESGG